MKPIQLAMPIKIWYKPLPRFPKTFWPIIEVKLSYKSQTLPQPVFALIDSGSNISILHPEIAGILGFDQKKLGMPKDSGLSVSGNYKSWALPEPLDLDIYGRLLSFEFSVIDNPNLIWPCILGEDSIFQVSRLDFQKFKGYFEVRFREDIN